MLKREPAKSDITTDEIYTIRRQVEKFLPGGLVSKILQAASLTRPRTDRRRKYDIARAIVDWCECNPGIVSINYAAPPARNPPPIVFIDADKTEEEILKTLEAKRDTLNRVKAALDVQVGGSHYKQFEIQPAEIAEKNKLSFLEACVVKRLHRHSRGGKGLQDIEKSIHELRLLAKLQYGVEL